MARHKDLVGFYVAGGGMEGAVDALRETDAHRTDPLSSSMN